MQTEENNDNDDKFITEANEELDLVRRHFHTNKLYGRASQSKQLTEVCLRASTACSPEVALVVGCSGTGKSSLAQAVMDPLKKEGFHFISGKFDQLRHAEPLSAIITAFNRYFDDISRSSPEHIDLIRAAILDATGGCSGVLTEFFPSLSRILGDQSTTPAPVGAKEAQHRFEYVFRLMVRAIATPSDPIVFFLDDLHWADTYSLHLMSTLVTDREIENFLFLGCFREDEVDNTHSLIAKLHEIEIKSVNITTITVTNLKREDIYALVSDAFQMTENLTTSLTDIVHQKTNGNIFCVTQFLQSLYDGGLLQRSSASNGWELNIRSTEAEHVPDDAARIMVGKILQLPEEAQHALKLLSCVGSSCFESTIELFLDEAMVIGKQEKNLVISAGKTCKSSQSDGLFSCLDLAVHEGLLNKEGSTYNFAHDQIQCAAYSLIPEDEKCLWHLQIGYAIWNNVPDEDKDKVVFLAADQMNCGIATIESEEQKVFLAMLNLRAGERAKSLSTFSSSATYFSTGIKLLGQDQWEKHYDLSLHLHNYCAEAEYCNGNFSEVGQLTGVVLTEAKSYYDKLRSYLILVKALGAQNKLFEAIDIGVGVLEHLGKQLPLHLSNKSDIYASFNKIKSTFEKMTRDEFLSINTMDDSDTLIAMNFLSELLLYTFWTRQDNCVCFVNLMMQLSLDYGLCKESCYALAACSSILCGLRDFRGSECTGRLALIFLERLDTQECLPRVYAGVYTGILARCEPSKKVSENFLRAYEVGMQTGDINFAMLTAYQYCGYSFWCGGKLEELKRNIQVFEKQMIEYKQKLIWNSTLPIKHAVLTLIDWTNDPSQRINEFMAETKKLLDEHIKQKRPYPASMCCFFCSFVAYIFCNFDFAKDVMETRRKLEETLCKQFDAQGASFFVGGLVSVALARKTMQDRWIKYALECLDKTKKSAVNSQHRVYLLEAEIDTLVAEKKSDAILNYEIAINEASQNEYIHEQAIANERAGDFCLSQGNFRSSHYYSEAYRLYLQWGAKGKAAQLKRNITDLP